MAYSILVVPKSPYYVIINFRVKKELCNIEKFNNTVTTAFMTIMCHRAICFEKYHIYYGNVYFYVMKMLGHTQMLWALNIYDSGRDLQSCIVSVAKFNNVSTRIKT